MPENPLPTRTVCDLVDIVRRDACVLLGLQTSLAEKEKELAALKSQVKLQASPDEESGKGSSLVSRKELIIPHSMMTSSDFCPPNLISVASSGSGLAIRKPPILKRKSSNEAEGAPTAIPSDGAAAAVLNTADGSEFKKMKTGP